MQVSAWQKLIFRTSLALCVASLALVISLAYWHWLDKTHMVANAQAQAKQQAELAAGIIDQQVSGLSETTHSIAEDLSSGRLPQDQLTDRFKSVIDENPDLFGVGAAYLPYQHDSSVRLYAPYYRLNTATGQHELVQIEDSYDYTLPDGTNGVRTHWYHNPLDQGATWSEPLFGTASNAYIAPYISPFYEVDGSESRSKLAGVIFTNYSLEKVKLLLTTLELGRTGYAFLLSGNGLYISHPDEAYVAGSKTIFDVAEARNDAVLNSIGDLAAQGESGLIDYNNTVTGQPSWVFLEPIPSTNWTLGVVFIKDEISLSNEAARHRLVWIAVGSMSFLLFLTALVVRVHRGSPPRLWATALVFTVLSLGTILYIWSLAVGTDLDRNEEDVMVFDTAGVRKFLAPYEDRVRQQHRTDVVHIPTGIFIQSVEFSTANNVLVSGYIWQRYPAGTPEWVSQGFVLPEAIETPDIIESYRSDNGEVVGWNFRATLRQQFDYSKYPFDREDVWIRLWHQNFEREVVLVPDLISYKEVNPTSKPGLEQQDFVLEGWSTTSSFFSYRLNSYNTNFGMEQFLVHDDVPELYFNIGLARNFTNPFVSNLLPVVVVVFLLFAVLMIASREDDKSQLFGFSTSNVLTFCAALFFVVILGHIDLRSKLTASEIIYLEYFFFVMYIAILAVSVNSILFVSHAGVSLIQYKDNFIPKLLYWPVIAALLLGVTLWVFY